MSFRSSRDTQALASRRLAALADSFGRASLSGTPVDLEELPAAANAEDLPSGVGASRPGRHAARSALTRSRVARLSPQHLAIIAIAMAAVCVLAGWHVLRSVPDSEPVGLSSQQLGSQPTPDPAVAAAGTSSAPPPTDGVPADSSSAGLLVVDVTGKVRRPGIVELPPGSRVVDALEAAGGARPAADTSALNQARLLVDGEQIVVGLPIPGAGPIMGPGSAADPEPTGTAVNLNTASAQELETLPGVGPVTAAAILEWRAYNGAFTSVDELLEVSGIGEATLEELKPHVRV